MKHKLCTAITVFSMIAQPAAAVCAADSAISDRSEAVNVYINTFEQKQTIKGVGGAFTWYSNWLNATPNKEEVYNILFRDAGLDLIRLKNSYGYSDDGTFSAQNEKEIIECAEKAAGKNIPVLMSSWSPPASLKSNSTVSGTNGTLKKDENGQYMYNALGKYFADAVKAYREGGVNIDYLSIQNEPDFNAAYDGCVFAAQESEQFAQYSKALDATYEALKGVENPPLLIGPDSMTANDAYITSMINPSIAYGDGRVAAIGHHLYAGGSAEDPDGYIRSMNNLRDNFPNIPKWQTEYYHGDFVQTAWLITNTFVEEDAEAYIYWDTIWAADGGLVGIENPWYPTGWTHEKGYVVNDKLYALAHFSKFTDGGYIRVDSSVDYQNNDIKIAAFNSPGKDKLTLVLTNTQNQNSDIKLNLNGYEIDTSKIYLSECAEENKKLMQDKGAVGEDMTVNLPAQSVMTIDITGHQGTKPDKILKGEPDPNGRTTKTTAKYGTPVIDGKIDSVWNTIPYEQIIQTAHGDHGASGRFKTMWDKNNLYVLVYVKDDTINDISQKQDSVEIFINESNSKASAYGAGDAQYIVNCLNQSEAGSGHPDMENFRSAVSKTEEGYIVEAAVPFQSIKPKTRTTIGFDICINDSHGASSSTMLDYILKWCDSGRETASSLANIGEIEFAVSDVDNPYQRIEAEDWSEAGSDVRVENCDDTDGGQDASYIDTDDWIKYSNVDFGETSPFQFSARVAAPYDTDGEGLGAFDLYIDDTSNPDNRIGTLSFSPTGDWQVYTTASCRLEKTVTGKHDLYFKITDGGFNINWWCFTQVTTVNIGAEYGCKNGAENTDSKATAFVAFVSGNIEFDTITWKVKGKNEGETEYSERTLVQRLENKVFINNSSLCFGLIVSGLHDGSAAAEATLSTVN